MNRIFNKPNYISLIGFGSDTGQRNRVSRLTLKVEAYLPAAAAAQTDP
jgi:hypothetical protein